MLIAEAATPGPNVFVSRASTLTPAQREVEGAWLAGLAELGFTPLVLRREDYVPGSPTAIRQAISRAHGALILGFRQVRIDRGELRPGTPEARQHAGWTATPWNQVEGGLAIMADLPVLVVPEEGVVEGIFDGDAWAGPERTAPIGLWNSPGADANPAVRAWALEVRDRADSTS
jgi:hypothetical protein